MVIHEKSKSVILRIPDPAKVTDVIPKSKVVVNEGVTYTQVYHGPEETKVLRNLGFDVPHPILSHYEWRAKPGLNPFDYQKNTAAFMASYNRAICLNDMGTGKTLSVLWALDYMMDEGVVDKAIIIAPLSTMNSVWANEISTHFMFNRKCAVLHGPKEKRLRLLADTDVDFYIINHDGIKVLEEELKKRSDITHYVVDEAGAYRNASSNRYKTLNRLAGNDKALWLLTGTPCPTSPIDAWALSRLLRNPNSPKYHSAFRDMTMTQITQYKWVPKPDAYQTAYKVLQPGIRYRKEDVLSELPPVSFQLRRAEQTKEQAKLYAQMQRTLVADVAGGGVAGGGVEITAANAAVKLLKLLQINTGAVYDEHGSPFNVDASKRLSVLKELVEESAHKCIVFVPFTAVLAQVKAYLSKWWTVEVVDGSTSVGERKRIFHEFQNTPDPKVLLAHPATTAHGLTLTAADHTIWYAPIYALEIFQQANNRMDRPGQKFNMTISMIAANKLEYELYKALRNNQRMQNSVLDLYKETVGVA